MSLAFKHIKVYVKLCSLIAALLFAVVVIVANRGPTVDVWFLRWYGEVDVWLVIVCTAVITLLLWLVIRPTFSVFRDMSDLRKSELERDQQKRQKELMDRLDKQESAKAADVVKPAANVDADDDESHPV